MDTHRSLRELVSGNSQLNSRVRAAMDSTLLRAGLTLPVGGSCGRADVCDHRKRGCSD